MSASTKLAAALSDLETPTAGETDAPHRVTGYEAAPVPRCACHTSEVPRRAGDPGAETGS